MKLLPLLLACGALSIPSAVFPQTSPAFATRVVAFTQGSGTGIFKPANVLGPPQGGGWSAGSTQVLSLGTGGAVTLAFAVTICDGPGADLAVFENGFVSGPGWNVFAELAFLEVSTDGVNFARFPNRYTGPTQPPGPFGVLPLGCTTGLVGATPVMAGPAVPADDPCLAGGDAFDLADLQGHPLVAAGTVDLARINYIRIVDVVAGQDRDSLGTPIQDPGGGADIDAVAVLNHRGNQGAGTPRIELALAPGRISLLIADADGLQDLLPASLHASINATAIDPAALLSLFRLVRYDGCSLELELAGLPVGLAFTIGFSVRDRSGRICGSRRTVH